MAKSITATRQDLLDCVCDALAEAGRPVCECYGTIGSPMVSNCCECEEGVSGEVSVSFAALREASPETLRQVTRIRPCKGGIVVAEFHIILSRCFPTLTEEGEVPDKEEQTQAAYDIEHDVSVIWNALTCCLERDLERTIDEFQVENDPTGGCSYLAIRVSAVVNPNPAYYEES